jgi:3-hydroxyacyl-CoA dehydrogenase
MQIKKVGVVGAGTMGSSIAVALIGAGYPVLLKDINQEAIDAGLRRIEKLLESRMKKGLSADDVARQKQQILTTTDFTRFSQVDLVIEAVSENLDIKKAIFEELERYCRRDAILATNTSGLSITRIAAFTKSPDRVVGLHFFNPAHLMKLVEVVAGLETSEETVESVIEFGKTLGKLAVRVEECASFLVNRLLGRYMNEALWCLQEGSATVEDIDKAVTDYVMPVGPLALRDMNGADIGLSVAKFNYQEYGERFRPAPLLEAMVDRNLLGQKVGKGFYTYDAETRKRVGVNPEIQVLVDEINNGNRPPSGEFSPERLFLPMINEAFMALQEKVCKPEDLDPALMAGLGMRKGPFTLASDIGLPETLRRMEVMFENYGERFRPAPLLKRYVWGGRKAVV